MKCVVAGKIGYVPRKQNKELSKILKTGWDKIFIAYVSDWQGCGEKRKITVEILIRQRFEQIPVDYECSHNDPFAFDRSAFVSYKNAENAQLYFSSGGNTGTLAGRMAPERIDKLYEGEIFVFGSNAMGHHNGGAAYAAMKKFGAIYGQGDGLQGQSYAISTMEGLVNTSRNINHFIDFASEHQELKFFVTPIGCGIAGYTPLQIAPLFRKALTLPNVYLPRIFWEYFWMVEGVGPDFFQPNKEWSRWDRL